jgi:amidase
VLAGPEPGDPYLPPPTQQHSYLDEVGRDPGTLHIGVVTSLPFAETDPDCVAAVEAAAATLSSLGHRVARGHPEAMDRNDYMYDFIRVIRVSLVTELAMFEAGLGRRFTGDDVEEGTWINCERGSKVSGPDYVSSRDRLHVFTRNMLSWWHDGNDLLLTPTVAIPPPPVGYLVDGDERTLTGRLAGVTPFLPQFNVTGQPAITLPLGASTGGLPIGVQLVAAPGREDLLIRVASQLEQVVPWIDRRPAVWIE